MAHTQGMRLALFGNGSKNMNREDKTQTETLSDITGEIGLSIESRLSKLETHQEYAATKEWVWKHAFTVFVGTCTLIGLILKFIKI